VGVTAVRDWSTALSGGARAVHVANKTGSGRSRGVAENAGSFRRLGPYQAASLSTARSDCFVCASSLAKSSFTGQTGTKARFSMQRERARPGKSGFAAGVSSSKLRR
jgi:hypothetical protein